MGHTAEPRPGSPRAFLEALIENLIDYLDDLDDLDGDSDAEDGTDGDGCAAEDLPYLEASGRPRPASWCLCRLLPRRRSGGNCPRPRQESAEGRGRD